MEEQFCCNAIFPPLYIDLCHRPFPALILSYSKLQVPGNSGTRNMSMEEIDIVKRTPLIRPLKRRMIDRLKTVMAIKCTELICLNETPRQRTHDIHAILIHRSQNLGQECPVID